MSPSKPQPTLTSSSWGHIQFKLCNNRCWQDLTQLDLEESSPVFIAFNLENILSVLQVHLHFMLLFKELSYWPLVRQHLELHPLQLRFQRHFNLQGAWSSDPVFGSWMTAGLWACLTCCRFGSMAAYHTLVGASCSRQSPSTEQRIPEIPANKSRLLSFPLIQTCEQDPSIHHKRMVHLLPVFSLRILPEYFLSSSSAPEMLSKSSGKKSASWADSQQVL